MNKVSNTEIFLTLKNEIDGYIDELKETSENHFGCDANNIEDEQIRHLKSVIRELKKEPRKADINRKNAPMTYERAIEVLEFNPNRTKEQNAERAKLQLERIKLRSPLRYSVACKIIID